tara:strand:- start:1632 stop:1808 length:177 start_codon:yes stop_codon:yes gene_type:complete
MIYFMPFVIPKLHDIFRAFRNVQKVHDLFCALRNGKIKKTIGHSGQIGVTNVTQSFSH